MWYASLASGPRSCVRRFYGVGDPSPAQCGRYTTDRPTFRGLGSEGGTPLIGKCACVTRPTDRPAKDGAGLGGRLRTSVGQNKFSSVPGKILCRGTVPRAENSVSTHVSRSQKNVTHGGGTNGGTLQDSYSLSVSEVPLPVYPLLPLILASPPSIKGTHGQNASGSASVSSVGRHTHHDVAGRQR